MYSHKLSKSQHTHAFMCVCVCVLAVLPDSHSACMPYHTFCLHAQTKF